jgi:hypothetical protein
MKQSDSEKHLNVCAADSSSKIYVQSAGLHGEAWTKKASLLLDVKESD